MAPSYTVGGNVNWLNHHGEQYGGSEKELIIELPYDLVIPLLGKYQGKKTRNSKRHGYLSVQCSTIYYSQDMEAN